MDDFVIDFAGNPLARKCITWRGPVSTSGYGKMYLGMIDGKRRYALPHRIAYEQHVGAIPDAHQIDHVCRNRTCIEPTHLEAVTAKENIRRAKGWINDTCPKGHYQPEDGKCKKCHAERQLNWANAKWRNGTELRDKQRAYRARIKEAS